MLVIHASNTMPGPGKEAVAHPSTLQTMRNSQQDTINAYFADTWRDNRPDLTEYEYTGWALLNEILLEDSVLDIGCGDNDFKKYRNVYGIDPANAHADKLVTVEEFHTDSLFDVALCLGSINFGNEDTIRNQIKKVVSLIKGNGRIYWRCNPGVHDHPSEKFRNILVFPWTFDMHYKLAIDTGCKVVDLKWDKRNRIYAKWIKIKTEPDIEEGSWHA